jgi:CPA2 family monovalent cation:H+ antiporter-2
VIGIILLTFLGSAGHTERSLYSILTLVGSFLMVVGVFMLLSRWGLHLIERLLRPLAGHQLAVFLVVGLVLGLGALGHAIGLSGALLTFLLGVLIPEENPFYETASRMLVPFKELAVGLFFFAIPSTMVLTQVPGLSVLGLSLVGIGLKGVSTYVGAWVYGLGPRGRYRAALSFLPKGEFSLLFAQLGQAVSGLIVGIVILSSVVGTILFVQAERLSNYLVPRKPKKGAVGASVARG